MVRNAHGKCGVCHLLVCTIGSADCGGAASWELCGGVPLSHSHAVHIIHLVVHVHGSPNVRRPCRPPLRVVDPDANALKSFELFNSPAGLRGLRARARRRIARDVAMEYAHFYGVVCMRAPCGDHRCDGGGTTRDA